MENKDNKTQILKKVELTKFKNLLENNYCNLATVSKTGKPNLAIAMDVKVLNDTVLMISNNEMIHTPENILNNKNVVVTSLDGDLQGIRLTGSASYHTDGNYFEICKENFLNDQVNPKGAIVIEVSQIEEF